MHVAHTDIYILHRLVNNKAACTVYITWLNRGFTDFSNSTFREFSNPIYLAGFLGFGFSCVLVMCVLTNHSLRFQAWNWIGLLFRKYLYVHAFYDLKRLTIQMLKKYYKWDTNVKSFLHLNFKLFDDIPTFLKAEINYLNF